MLLQLTFFVVAALNASPAFGGSLNIYDNKGNTPFFLQDPFDDMCLGPHGFTVCNEDALWILTKRSGKKTYSLVSLLNKSPEGLCLQQRYGHLSLFGTDKIVMGPCTTKSAKSWDFDFIDQKQVKLSNRGLCLVRGKHFRSAANLQPCRLGEFSALTYHPANIHKNGFYLKSADGFCFDGTMFKRCSILSTANSGLMWGIGIKYTSWTGSESRYFFDFSDRMNCLIAKPWGSKVDKGPCSGSGALGWSLQGGQLSRGHGSSAMCVARRPDDTAVLEKCSEASEFMVLELPVTYSASDLAELKKHEHQLTEEEKKLLNELIGQQHSTNHVRIKNG